MRMVLFHKTTAIWNKASSLGESKNSASNFLIFDKKPPSFEPNQEMMEFFDTDIYIQMCKQICKILGIGELHIVQGLLDDEEKNWTTHHIEGYCKVDETTTYWCVNSPEQLLGFVDADIIFSRGNYSILHNWLAQKNNLNDQVWIHYPATSLRYPHLERYGLLTSKLVRQKALQSKIDTILTGMRIEHKISGHPSSPEDSIKVLLEKFTNERKQVLGGPYTIVLVDDSNNLDITSIVHPDSLVYRFVKPALWTLDEIPYTRPYDLIYCGTTLQSTKNHHAFGQLLEKLDNCADRKLTIVIAGNKKNSDILTKYLEHPYRNLELLNIGEVSRSELQLLFSKTKLMLITSGRDANPRTIQESLVSGARVIAIDTLSDGFEFLKNHPLLGEVLKSDVSSWYYSRNGNLEFRPNIQLASLLMIEIKKSQFPDLVASIARDKLHLGKCMKNLCRLIKSVQ